MSKLERFVFWCVYDKVFAWLSGGLFTNGRKILTIHSFNKDDAVMGAYYSGKDVCFKVVALTDFHEEEYIAHVIFEKDEPTQTYQWGAKEMAKKLLAPLTENSYA